MSIVEGGLGILTNDKAHFVTAVSGGGLGGPDSGPLLLALHTDATKVGPWETFELIIVSGGPGLFVANTTFALRTAGGNYVTAVNNGGVGGPNNANCPIHTDATEIGDWETFAFNVNHNTSPPTVTIQTWNGNYLTAVNGGGVGGADNVPVHSDATQIGPWETFSVLQTPN